MTTVTVVTDTSGDEQRRRGLRQMRLVALALLVLAAVVYVLTLGKDGVWGLSTPAPRPRWSAPWPTGSP